MSPIDHNDPEFATATALAEYLFDEDRTEYTHDEMLAVNYRTQATCKVIQEELAGYGLRLRTRPVPRHTRGFKTSSNDRWFGPGSSPTHGGSGFSNFE